MRVSVLALGVAAFTVSEPSQAQRTPADPFIWDRAHAVIRGQGPYIAMPCDISASTRFTFTDEAILDRGAYNAAGAYWPVRVRSSGTMSCDLTSGPLAMSFPMTLVLRLGHDDFGQWKLQSFEVESRAVRRAADIEAPETTEGATKRVLVGLVSAQ